MTPTDLRRIGEALYGERFVAPLARDLQVHRKTVQRWLSGAIDIPAGLGEETAELVRERVQTLRQLLRAA